MVSVCGTAIGPVYREPPPAQLGVEPSAVNRIEDEPGSVSDIDCAAAYVPGAGEAVGMPTTVPVIELPPAVSVPLISEAYAVDANESAMSAGTRIRNFIMMM